LRKKREQHLRLWKQIIDPAVAELRNVQHMQKLTLLHPTPERMAALDAYAKMLGLLIDKLKFDLRIYVLVTSVAPLRVYMAREGLARFCTEEYESISKQNRENQFKHLTNYAINKNNAAFQAPTEAVPHVVGGESMDGVGGAEAGARALLRTGADGKIPGPHRPHPDHRKAAEELIGAGIGDSGLGIRKSNRRQASGLRQPGSQHPRSAHPRSR
jgi:hypothetical protein